MTPAGTSRLPTPASGLHARLSGPAGAPLVVLAGAIGTDLHLWDGQVDALVAIGLRVLAYDHPGHGQSPPAPAGARVADLGRQLLALLDDAGAERAHLVGLSMGGVVAQQVAAHAPDRVDRLVLLCTDAALPPAQRWTDRAVQVRAEGTGSLVAASRERWFAPGSGAGASPAGRAQLGALAACDDEGYARCCEVLAEADLRGSLDRVRAATLVVAGGQDQALPVERLRALADALPDARLEVLPGCGHLPPVEAPDLVADLLAAHLAGAAG